MANCKSIHGLVIWKVSNNTRADILIQSGVGIAANVSRWMRFDKIPVEHRRILVQNNVIKVCTADDGGVFMEADLRIHFLSIGTSVFIDLVPEDVEATDEDALLAITKYIEFHNGFHNTKG